MNLDKKQILQFLTDYANLIAKHKASLTDLDRQIGDGDHGTNMDRGMAKVLESLDSLEDKSISDILKSVGMTLVNNIGGASGPLYGTAFMKAGMLLKDKEKVSEEDVSNMLGAMIDGIKQRGKAEQGEKTMLDALIPAKEAFDKAVEDGKDMAAALEAADEAAWKGVDYTKTIKATKGRASYLGERSIGHQDPGATSAAYMMDALADVAAGDEEPEEEDDLVGIVVVSHSNKIAEGVKELALEMAPTAKIASAGGTKDNSIGTDLQKITDAIDSVMSPAGVILLVDLGSALMSSEMAIETSDDASKVKIMDAPIVEGAIFAAIESSLGSDMERIEEVLEKAKSESKF